MPNWIEAIVAAATGNSGGGASSQAQLAQDPTQPGHYTGKGSPNGVLAVAVGSTYVRSDGGSSTTFYVKETGGTTSNGWVAK